MMPGDGGNGGDDELESLDPTAAQPLIPNSRAHDPATDESLPQIIARLEMAQESGRLNWDAGTRFYITLADGTVLRAEPDCDHTEHGCTYTYEIDGDEDTFSPWEHDGDEAEIIMIVRGISMVEFGGPVSEDEDETIAFRQYGAWMNHGGFGVSTYLDVDGDTARLALADGIPSGTRPTADATWEGVMVGTRISGTDRDNILQGDARLVYSMTGRDIDATFSNIVDLDNMGQRIMIEGEANPTIAFMDVPVGTDGEYLMVVPGQRFIRGNILGPNHEETTGVFQDSDIIGAYGAKRPSN